MAIEIEILTNEAAQTVIIEPQITEVEIEVAPVINEVAIEITPFIVNSVGGSGDGSALLIDFVAHENILTGQVVIGGGLVANSANVGHRNKIIGIAKENVNNGFAGQVVGFGKIQNSAWSWNAGDRIYLNGSSLSTVVPTTGFLQQIGVASAADIIDVNIKNSILL